MTSPTDSDHRLSLRIEPIVERAEEVARHVQRDLPANRGIIRAAAGVAEAAHEAERVTRSLRRVFSPHRLPAYFLALAILGLGFWCYWNFLRVVRLTVAMPDRDAVVLRKTLARRSGIDFKEKVVGSSTESVRLIEAGDVDLAFVQGGVPFSNDLLYLETPGSELILFLTRKRISHVNEIRRVLTSVENAGSHTVARQFFAAWHVPQAVEYVHDWTQLTASAADAPDGKRVVYAIPDDIDAVFVVKDPGNEKALLACQRLQAAGFRLAAPDLGARALQMKFLQPYQVPPGYLNSTPAIPANPVMTYSVKDYLIARRGLTPRLLSLASHLFDGSAARIEHGGLEADLATASEMLQGVEAFLGIVAYIGLAFLALLGIEMMTYRRRFNELDSLISLISMHQSDKDVLGVTDAQRLKTHLMYLSLCSDLLGLISVIAGYYTQENASLLYNNLLGIIHDRSSSLKLNIQLKIQHASITLPATPEQAVFTAERELSEGDPTGQEPADPPPDIEV